MALDKDKKVVKKTGTKKVKTYNVDTKKTGSRMVKKGSPAAKVAKKYGSEIDFGSSASQRKATGKSKKTIGTNRNKKATKSTTGTIGGNTAFKYTSGGKMYNYVPGAQNKNPKTGRKL